MFLIIKLKKLIAMAATVAFLIISVSVGSVYVFSGGAEEGISLPILMYHHILKDAKRHGSYVISPEEFEDDLKFIKDSGFTTVVIEDLIKYTKENIPLPEKPIMLTFDDGYLSTLEYACPLLEKYEMKAVVSVIVKCTEDYSKNGDRHVAFAHLSWEDIKNMSESGVFEVQNHTYDMHKNKKGERHGAKKVSGESLEHYREEFIKDVSLAQKLLYENSLVTPTCFTYPFGMISDESYSLVKEMGFSSSLSCFEGINTVTDDPECLYRLKRYNRAHNRSAEKILGK